MGHRLIEYCCACQEPRDGPSGAEPNQQLARPDPLTLLAGLTEMSTEVPEPHQGSHSFTSISLFRFGRLGCQRIEVCRFLSNVGFLGPLTVVFSQDFVPA